MSFTGQRSTFYMQFIFCVQSHKHLLLIDVISCHKVKYHCSSMCIVDIGSIHTPPIFLQAYHLDELQGGISLLMCMFSAAF